MHGGDSQSGKGGLRRDLAAILLLLALVTPLRAWIVCHTEVCARDSIGFIRYALEFEKLPLAETLRKNCQHPGYPLAILAVSWPVRSFMGGVTPYSMQVSAQVASTIAALLLIVPMYCLGRQFFDRRVSFWGVLLFQLLPGSGQLLSDGLSEALFFLLCVTAVLFAVIAIERRRLDCFALSGLFTGLSYLTRPEGVLIVLATWVALIGKQYMPAWRWSWRQTLLAGGVAAGVMAAVGSPYLLATGGVTNKPTFKIMLNQLDPPAPHPSPRGRGEGVRAEPAPGHPLLASIFAAVMRERGSLLERVCIGGCAIIREIIQATHYLGQIPILLGLWFSRNLLWQRPGSWIMTAWCALHTGAVYALAVKVGYVSDRHIMVFVLVASFFLAWTLCYLPARILGWRGGEFLVRRRSAFATLLLAGFVGVCLAKTLLPLHANRAGHHAAGCWLAERLRPGDVVHDDHCWSHYYAGKVFEEHHLQFNGPAPAPAADSTFYVVMTRSRDEERAKERLAREQRLRQEDGKVVFRWPAHVPENNAGVVVYALRRPPN